MFIEKKLKKVAPRALSVNGTAGGLVTVADARGFFVGQEVFLSSNTKPAIRLKIKRFNSLNSFFVGDIKEDIRDRSNISAYTVADGATIGADEQSRPGIKPDDYNRAVYVEEPIVAKRVILVDENGDYYNADTNPNPSLTEFIRNGDPQVVTEDTIDPSNNRPLPVKLTGFDGDVKIEAENLNLETQIDGVYDATENTLPDTVGVVAHERSLSTNKTNQKQRVTAKRGTVDTDTVSQDVSLHDEDGNAYTSNNPFFVLTEFVRNGNPQIVTEDTANPANNRPLPVKLTGLDGDVKIESTNLNLEVQTDGIYDGIQNTVPDTVGMVAHERSLSTDKTNQKQRVTAKRGTLDTDTVSQDVSLHDQNGNAYTVNNPLFVNSKEIIKSILTPIDFFGNTSVSTRTNQIEVPFDDLNYAQFIDSFNVSTGNITQANGQVTLTTGTNANGRYAILSKDFIKYRPGTEIGWGFTWNMPTASTATSVIRIGATDNVLTWDNSVYFSHENGIFSLIYRRNNVTIFNVQPSGWLDKCDGSAGSSYVDFDENPVVLDITKDQLARIRAGLFGHAGFIVEIIAPNQKWVKIYEHTNINLQNIPVFANFDLKIGAEVKKIAGNSNVFTLSSACWAGWTGSNLSRLSDPISDRTLAQVTRTVIEGKSSSGGGTYVPVKVAPSGSLTTEADIASIAQVAGQETMANSFPVVIASDQTTISVSFDQNEPNQVGFKLQSRDAFGRLITVEPIELGSHDHRISKLPRYFDEIVVGGASSLHNSTTVSVDMTTGIGATDSVIRQTFRQFEYIRGNAQIGKFSLNPGGPGKANNERLWGLGDAENGIFWGIDSLGLKVVRRSKTSGVVVDETVYQANFNGDKLNGLGLSGANIDLGKQNLFLISFSWLGTNIIQMRLAYRGEQVIAHTFYPGNSESTAWSQSGSLPIRFEIKNTGITPSSTTMKVCCSAVFTVGSSKEISTYGSISTGTNTVSIGVVPSVVAGIRLRPDKKYVALNAESYDLLPISGTGVAYYRVILRPTLTGALWNNYSEITQVLANSPTYVAGTGYLIQEGFANLTVQGRNAVEIPARINAALGYSINNEPDALIIIIQTTTGNGSLYFAGSFREVY